MLETFDIFRIENDDPLWLGAASTLEKAVARAESLAVSAPGEYLILNQRTGRRISLKLGAPDP
jgi:hypothetical protein